MKALAQGRMDGDTVVVDDVAQANRLHNKSHAGIPETGNTLRLHRIEAAHCIAKGWLDVPGTGAQDLLVAGADQGAQNEVEHLCYHDLRERGLVVRVQDGALVAWKRGETPKQEPWFTTRVFPERVPITAADLADLPDTVSIVDEDGAVTHYTVAAVAPSGDLSMPELPAMQGTLLDDRVLVTDPEAAAALASVHRGLPHGDGRILSLVEATSLVARGVLDVPVDLEAHALERHRDHAAVTAAYDALQAAGVLPKSGFRFGTHLRAYTADPDTVHAEWLVHCAMPDRELRWSDISRGVRLAHGVRKQFLVAVTDDPVRFIGLAWFRP